MEHVDLHPKLTLVYTTKADGNVDPRFSDKSLIKQNRKKIFDALGLKSYQIIEAQQIHQDRILPLNEENTKMWRGHVVTGVDGLITSDTTSALMIRVADCVPVVLYDPTHHVVGLFHIGWRSAIKQLHLKGLKIMTDMYESNPKEILAWIGPSALPCHYRVPDEPEQKKDPAWKGFIRKKGDGWAVDIPGFIIADLQSQGIYKKHTTASGICTLESDDLYSHQRSVKEKTKKNRFAIIVKLA